MLDGKSFADLVAFIEVSAGAAGGTCHGPSQLQLRVCGQSLRPSLAPNHPGDVQSIFSCIDSQGPPFYVSMCVCVYIYVYTYVSMWWGQCKLIGGEEQ